MIRSWARRDSRDTLASHYGVLCAKSWGGYVEKVGARVCDQGRGPSRKIGATVLVAPTSPCRCSRWLQRVPAQWVNGGKRQGVNTVMQPPLSLLELSRLRDWP